LRRHLALAEAARALDQPIRQRRLAMVDMRNDRKIPDSFQIRNQFSSLSEFRFGARIAA
jgi:hypothetical protein